MARVLIADDMSPRAAEILSAAGVDVDTNTGLSPDGLAEIIGGYDGVLVRSASKITSDILAHAPKLRVIGRAGIGVDNIDIPAATAKGCVVMNAPSGNATTTAEHAVSMLMSLSRHIPQATGSMREGKWEKKKFKGREVTGKTVGIVGLGNIGKIVCSRLLGLRMKVAAFDPFITAEAARQLGAEKVSLDELFATADYITVHTPLIEQTRHLIGTKAFKEVKKGVFIINCARGGIVDESALLKALDDGIVAGAALDVFETEPPPADDPLRTHPKVILTPHLGASTVEAQEAVAVQIAEQAAAYLVDGTVTNALNTPSISGQALAALEPWLQLGAKLGKLAAQVHTADIDRVEVRHYSNLGAADREAITTRVLVEVLNQRLEGVVNAISAPSIAKERGVNVESSAAGDHPHFTKLVEVVVSGGSRTLVQGAVFGRDKGRVVNIDGYHMEMEPEGHGLIVKNDDHPGIIGHIGTQLGARGINVSRLAVGLRDEDTEALAVWSTDERVTDEAIEAIRGEGIRRIDRIEL